MVYRVYGGDNSNLSINVVTENIESKGLVTGTYLASGAAIGVTVLNTSGANYDGTVYNNIKLTSSGTSTSQTWAGASTVKYIPSCGQLGLIWLNKIAIDNALTSIGVIALGTALLWSSSELNSYGGWSVGLNSGLVDWSDKSTYCELRLVRDL